MKNIKQLLEAEYIGKEITVFKIIFASGIESSEVKRIINPPFHLKVKQQVMKVIGVSKDEVDGGYEYRLDFEDGFHLYID